MNKKHTLLPTLAVGLCIFILVQREAIGITLAEAAEIMLAECKSANFKCKHSQSQPNCIAWKVWEPVAKLECEGACKQCMIDENSPLNCAYIACDFVYNYCVQLATKKGSKK